MIQEWYAGQHLCSLTGYLRENGQVLWVLLSAVNESNCATRGTTYSYSMLTWNLQTLPASSIPARSSHQAPTVNYLLRFCKCPIQPVQGPLVFVRAISAVTYGLGESLSLTTLPQTLHANTSSRHTRIPCCRKGYCSQIPNRDAEMLLKSPQFPRPTQLCMPVLHRRPNDKAQEPQLLHQQ
eukprot:m.255195 g.255195  ORF g.255195 m.255195 type:complete len:181 (+) comp15496_c0_seq27:3104-3646(+)